MDTQILYQIQPDPEKHLWRVKCTLLNPHPEGQLLTLPAWIPGSYLIRDFAKHIVSISAMANGKPVALIKRDKQTWQAPKIEGPLSVVYDVYAFDLVPRGAHVDNTHAFLNGSRIFLKAEGLEDVPCEVQIKWPSAPQYQTWRIATSLPCIQISANENHYKAEDYEDLIDHPLEMGTFEVKHFEAFGVPHELYVTGKQNADLERLSRDLKKICEHHIQFFGQPAPFKRYVFLLTVLGEGYGGLEHRNASALHCARTCLPVSSHSEPTEAYISLLGLFSHEYFHAWHVKRIRPQALKGLNLCVENYTQQLWIFEGITSYYDDLALVRAHQIREDQYLNLLANNIARLYATPGRLKQTLEEASFDAWIKFYKPDENTPNATVSYYSKGALVALALDLHLRLQSQNQHSLDKIMKILWQQYGMTEKGLSERAFETLVIQIAGSEYQAFFDACLRSTEELPLEALFAKMGLAWVPCLENAPKNDLGIRLSPGASEVVLSSVMTGGAAEAAGLSPQDVIIAINGLKVDKLTFQAYIDNFKAGSEVIVHAFRRDELMTFKVRLQEASPTVYTLKRLKDLSTLQETLLQGWLGKPIA